MSDAPDGPQKALEPLDYLTRSEHRVQVLEALTETIPKPGLDMPGYEPRELREMTGASEATISRILNEFDERGWAERSAIGEYTATPVGQSIAVVIAPLLDSMEVIQHLGDAVSVLPFNELTISMEHFHDATVREPTGPQPRDFGAFLIELLSDSSILYSLTYVPAPSGLAEEVTERITTGRLDSITIYPEHIIEFFVADLWKTTREQILAQLDAGAEWYIYDGHIASNIFILDETVVIENSQVNDVRAGTAIVTTDEVVREWALEVFERYREDSTAFAVEDLPE
jgi:predicted transcriptional regulator